MSHEGFTCLAFLASRMRLVRLLAIALAASAPFIALAPASLATDPPQVPCIDPRGCPDLQADASTMRPHLQTKTFGAHDCSVQEGSTEAGTRKLLRFTFTTPNVGPGDLIIGDPRMHPEWFEWGACHGHWHFKLYAEYRLWTPADFAAWDAFRQANPDMTADEALAASGLSYVRGQKQGFCVIDIRPYTFPALAKYFMCSFQGLSVGWADEYSAALDGQFVDVTGIPSGQYVLEEETNAHRLFEEANYNNNRAWVTVNL